MELLLSWLQQGFVAIVPFIVLLGILIFVHELGHFLVARWCGVRVEVFSLGFGKKIFSYKKGDTNYCISMIPLGGYVKMFGEQPGDTSISEEDKKFSFTHKNVYQRIAVVLAGPLMNFFFAIFVFWALAMIGEEMHRPLLGDISQETPAYSAGFRSGDTILSANGKEVKTYEEFSKVLNQKQNDTISVTVARSAGQEVVELQAPVNSKPNPNILSTDSNVGEIEGLTLFAKGTFVGVPASSPFYPAGLRTGDRILSINGQSVKYWRELDPVLSGISPKSALTMEIERFVDDRYEKSEKLTMTFAGGKAKEYSTAGLQLESPELYLSRIAPKSPAEAAGLKKGDRIISINGQPMKAWEDIVAAIKNFSGEGEALKFQIARGSEVLDLEIKPQMTSQMNPNGTEDRRYTVGVYPMVNFAETEPIIVKADNAFQALVRGTTRTWDVSVMMVMSFVRLFENKISPKNIGGVISIGAAASETFKMGLDKFLQMMAFISINLFILNLLPIPVLDGGHLVFYAIEAVKGSPLSIKKMELAQQVGLVLLMSLMVFALFNDITRFLGG